MSESSHAEPSARRQSQSEERARIAQCLSRAFTLKQPGSFAGLLNAIDASDGRLWSDGNAGDAGPPVQAQETR